jgi:hypothetical protein
MSQFESAIEKAVDRVVELNDSVVETLADIAKAQAKFNADIAKSAASVISV